MKDLILNLLAPRPKQGSGMFNDSVVLYGDSIMAGGMADALRDLGFTVVDRSVAGDTAANCWRRFPYELRSGRVVVLQPGTNDLTVGDDPVPALRRMATFALKEGREVVLTGISQREDARHATANPRIARLAHELHCHYAGIDLAELDSADGLHPNENMRKLLALLIGSALSHIPGLRLQ